jgi:hypothetical protein
MPMESQLQWRSQLSSRRRVSTYEGEASTKGTLKCVTHSKQTETLLHAHPVLLARELQTRTQYGTVACKQTPWAPQKKVD